MILTNRFQVNEISIAAETRERKSILNAQCFDTGNVAVQIEAACAQFELRNADKLCERNCRTGIYNCHGQSFLSKRSGIWEDFVVRQILIEDKYKQLDWDSAGPGDIVIYFKNSIGITHSATILQIRPSINCVKDFIVISKWGTYKEFIHPLATCPFEADKFEFWRVSDYAN